MGVRSQAKLRLPPPERDGHLAGAVGLGHAEGAEVERRLDDGPAMLVAPRTVELAHFENKLLGSPAACAAGILEQRAGLLAECVPLHHAVLHRRCICHRQPALAFPLEAREGDARGQLGCRRNRARKQAAWASRVGEGLDVSNRTQCRSTAAGAGALSKASSPQYWATSSIS